MEAVEHILKKYNFSRDDGPRIEIPGVAREDMAKLFHELGFTTGAEIGVEMGEYSKVLCENNPDLKLYSVDAWQRYRGYRDHVDQKKLNMFHDIAKKTLKPYNCEIVKGFSLDVVKDFEDGSLDFVYIDCNHSFENITNDIVEWGKKVRMGGVISGHDYKRYNKPALIHVAEVVDAYTECYSIRPYFVFGSRHPREDEPRDLSRSWMWVKAPYPKRDRKDKQ